MHGFYKTTLAVFTALNVVFSVFWLMTMPVSFTQKQGDFTVSLQTADLSPSGIVFFSNSVLLPPWWSGTHFRVPLVLDCGLHRPSALIHISHHRSSHISRARHVRLRLHSGIAGTVRFSRKAFCRFLGRAYSELQSKS